MAVLTKRERLILLRSEMDRERSTFIPGWRDLGENILPRRPRFFVSDANKGDRRNLQIVDGSATLAARTLRSGMMGGVTSPARPWFRLTTPDPDMAEFSSVKQWLYTAAQRMSSVFQKSNIYNTLPTGYGDMGVFGTACLSVEEDFLSTIRSYCFPIGSYKLANNDKLQVNVFQRDFRMTVRQLIERFGTVDGNTGKPNWNCFSSYVKNLWDNSNYETWVDVCQTIEPNRDFDPSKIHSKYKKYASTYFELGTSAGNDSNYLNHSSTELYLSEKGYDRFPILAPRWEVTGEDVYGTSCPGLDALGDIKALQIMQKRKAQAVEKMVNPPMVGPSSMRNSKNSILPGDISYVDDRQGTQAFKPAHEVRFSVAEVGMDIQEHQRRISRAFYEDLFLMLSESDRRQITAREVDERHEEKLLALGPVLEQLNQDLLDPLIDLTFDIMMRQGQFPPLPDELRGVKLRVEYISIMAQAQKLVGIESIERFASFSNGVVEAHPDAADKIDTDQMIEVYGDMTSIAPGIVRTNDQVAQIRDQKAKAQQQQQEMEQMQQGAQTAQSLSQTDMGGDTALNRLLQTAKAGSLVPDR